MMYGQMTAGSWIYIGSQGIVQGTYETFVEARPPALRRRPRRPLDSDRRPRRHGRRAAARGDDGRRLVLAIECQPSRIEMRLRTRYLDRQAATLDEALAIIEQAGAREEAGLGRPARQRRRHLSRTGAARRAARRRHRPDLGARSGQRLSAEGLDARASGKRGASSDPKARRARRASSRWRCMCAPCSTSTAWACRSSTTATTSARWRRRKASTTRSISRASCRPTSARCSAAASGRSAGPRSPAIPRTSIAPTPR